MAQNEKKLETTEKKVELSLSQRKPKVSLIKREPQQLSSPACGIMVNNSKNKPECNIKKEDDLFFIQNQQAADNLLNLISLLSFIKVIQHSETPCRELDFKGTILTLEKAIDFIRCWYK